MRAVLLLSLLVGALPTAAAELSPELQIALTSLRPGERARLEKAVGPVEGLPFYRGDFRLDPKARRVTGRVALTFTARRTEEDVLFRLTPNAAHPGAVALSGIKVNGAVARVALPDPSLVRVVFDPPLSAGEVATIELELKAKVPALVEGGGGLAAALHDGPGGDYGAFSVSEQVVSLAGLMPMLAPELNGKVLEGPSGIGDLGTFEPSHFIVSLAAPAEWRCFGGGGRVGEVPQGDGTTRTAYALAGARELSLHCLKHPEVATKQAGDVLVEAVTLKVDEKLARTMADHAAKSLEQLEAKLGPYPFKTLRVVETRLTGGAGGMEFPGLVTVSASLFGGGANPLASLGFTGPQLDAVQALLGPNLRDLLKSTLEFTIDHELAHQYTALLVGNDPVGDPLADEALTQHLALLLVEWRAGKAAADEVRGGQLKAAYQLHRLLGGADGRADRPTHEYASSREYAALVYGKAPLGYDAMRELVGDEAWLGALRRYVETNRYRWVTSRTLVDQVAKERPGSAAKLQGLAKRWFREAHGDEDVGGLDVEQLLNGAGRPGRGGGTLDPAALKQFEELMKALSGE